MPEATGTVSAFEALRTWDGPSENFSDFCQSMLRAAVTTTGSIAAGVCLDRPTGKKRRVVFVTDQARIRHGFEKRLRKDLLQLADHVVPSQSLLTNDSSLALPLFYQGRVIGTLLVLRDDAKPYGRWEKMILERIAAHLTYQAKRYELRDVIKARLDQDTLIVGLSEPPWPVDEFIEKASALDATALITGESGTGKELVAQALHFASRRRDGPFIAVNCAAINPELVESELFGHVKGAFTGATEARQGCFEQADGGTIFLDEIGELEFRLQAKLLRVLQSGEIQKVGGSRRRVDTRVVAATSADLKAMVKEKRFSEALYYRLNCLPLHLPPLRERTEDIRPLTKYFLHKYGKPGQHIQSDVLQLFEQYTWPGNIRELENSIQRLTVFSSGDAISLADVHRCLPEVVEAVEELKCSGKRSLREECQAISQAHEKRRILEVLEKNSWNETRASKELGLSQPALSKKMKKYGLRKS